MTHSHCRIAGVDQHQCTKEGKPQGVVLTPLTWNLVMYTLLSYLEGRPVQVISYANHIILISSAIGMFTMTSQIQ